MSILQHHSFGSDEKKKVTPPTTTTTSTTTTLAGPTTTSTTTTLPAGQTTTTTTTTTSTTTTIASGPGDVTPINPVNGQSIRSGLWSNPNTWKGGIIPNANLGAIISFSHTVTYDLADTQVRGVQINEGGTLQFKPDGTVSMRNDQNTLVYGVLRMRPNNASIIHTLTHININEQAFVGGGMNPLTTDVGTWVMGKGRLDIQGAPKKTWTRTTGTVNVGATSYTVQDATGWRVGDEIVIVPMDTPSQNTADWNDATSEFIDTFRPKFERRVITAINGNTVSFNGPLQYIHPQVTSYVTSAALGMTSNKVWNPEVMNLTRNVRIGGTKDPGDNNWRKFHRDHMFIRSTSPQNIQYLERMYCGPRQIQDRPRPALVAGRYGIHFHHCMDSSYGSVVTGCSIHDSGNRMYVPHMSHGILMNWNVGFNSMQEGMWWDFQEITHDSVWEDNIMACITQNGLDSNSRAYGMQIGDGNIARRNVAVYGTSGDHNGGGAFFWDADSEGVWIFEDNMAHSSRTGLFVWQNTSFNHTIINFDTFECYQGIFHGAYINSYIYRGGHHYKSLIDEKATSGNTTGILFEKVFFDAGGGNFCIRFHDSPVPNDILSSNKWVECVFRNYTTAAIRLFSTFPDDNIEKQWKVGAIIKCDYGNGNPYFFDETQNYDYPGWSLRNNNAMWVQPISGQSFKTVKVNGQHVTSNVDRFASTVYGSGYGLRGQYYTGSNFNNLAFTRIDSMIMFIQWSVDKRMSPYGVHHLVQGDNYSMRWTGKLEPQWSEPHYFEVIGGGGHRLWINNQLILDSWFEKGENNAVATSSTINMAVGQRYDIRLEHFNNSGARGCMLKWKSPSMPIPQNIPQSQMYTI